VRAAGEGARFYSPLVRNIAQKEMISTRNWRQFRAAANRAGYQKRHTGVYGKPQRRSRRQPGTASTPAQPVCHPQPAVSVSGNVEIVEMDRMRKLIADHMVMSKHTSPHVTSFVEVDVTELVNWRERVKKHFEARYGEKYHFHAYFY
jgi:2-oxoglutarate dehydrogenase E2 component (dihydrolipoamide succinyltransferase)